MNVDISKYDFRLLEVTGELYALDEHLKLIENQMKHIKKKERLKLVSYIRSEGISPDTADWALANDEFNYLIETLLPRFFRGSFLVAFYAVYESGVIEIARLIQRKQSQSISMDDLKGDFLNRAKKYFKHVLNFDLYVKDNEWEKVNILSELRNAFAHANGRMEMLKQKSRENITNWERQKKGIITDSGFIVCDAKIVSDIYQVVGSSLEDLVDRYKKWDDTK